MAEFGELLRKFRQQCNDPESSHGKLTQEKFAELVGDVLGIGYSGAAVSDWERGKSKIHADNRLVLMAFIEVLHEWGGLETIEEANQFLAAGNYRALNPEERQKIFKAEESSGDSAPSASETESTRSLITAFLASLFSVPETEVESRLARAQEGPSPAWPRVLAVFMRLVSDRFSISLTTVMWVWVWLFAWWLIAPSLRLPFANHNVAVYAMGMYIAGTLIVPLLIGLLIDTRTNEYWNQQDVANSTLLRLYTYQGAGIGFNLGYFIVFPFLLVRYYLGLGASLWLEFAAATLGLILGNMAARVVPHNLWLAYGRLDLADGWLFFVVALLGPLWGIFFLEYYTVLLTPVLGSIVILLALTGVVIVGMYQARKKA